MSKLLLDSKAVALLGDFCDTDTLQNRIELIGKTLTDWMISLSDMKEDLKKLRRAQQ